MPAINFVHNDGDYFTFRPELKPVEKETEVILKFPETDALSPPILQLNEVSFHYTPETVIFSNVNLSATLDSRICIVSYCVTYLITTVVTTTNSMKSVGCRLGRTEPVKRHF